MPKLIDYPRTSYTGAWELAEITDDTGGKSTIETAARKLNRKVSGSFKAIIGSAVKFGLVTSKREMLTTTTLFRRIKHAYDKQEELLFHREAFLTPPLFTQLCRKFRSKELPVQMLDVMLIREFGVEEINAQGVARAFVDGARMVGLLDEKNTIADIDALANSQPPRRQLASSTPQLSTFQPAPLSLPNIPSEPETREETTLLTNHTDSKPVDTTETHQPTPSNTNNRPRQAEPDAIASLFGLLDINETPQNVATEQKGRTDSPKILALPQQPSEARNQTLTTVTSFDKTYQIQISGPGINTVLSISEEEDVTLAIAFLEKIRRQLKS